MKLKGKKKEEHARNDKAKKYNIEIKLMRTRRCISNLTITVNQEPASPAISDLHFNSYIMVKRKIELTSRHMRY
jgi:hypothetical protein